MACKYVKLNGMSSHIINLNGKNLISGEILYMIKLNTNIFTVFLLQTTTTRTMIMMKIVAADTPLYSHIVYSTGDSLTAEI